MAGDTFLSNIPLWRIPFPSPGTAHFFTIRTKENHSIVSNGIRTCSAYFLSGYTIRYSRMGISYSLVLCSRFLLVFIPYSLWTYRRSRETRETKCCQRRSGSSSIQYWSDSRRCDLQVFRYSGTFAFGSHIFHSRFTCASKSQ